MDNGISIIASGIIVKLTLRIKKLEKKYLKILTGRR